MIFPFESLEGVTLVIIVPGTLTGSHAAGTKENCRQLGCVGRCDLLVCLDWPNKKSHRPCFLLFSEISVGGRRIGFRQVVRGRYFFTRRSIYSGVLEYLANVSTRSLVLMLYKAGSGWSTVLMLIFLSAE